MTWDRHLLLSLEWVCTFKGYQIQDTLQDLPNNSGRLPHSHLLVPSLCALGREQVCALCAGCWNWVFWPWSSSSTKRVPLTHAEQSPIQPSHLSLRSVLNKVVFGQMVLSDTRSLPLSMQLIRKSLGVLLTTLPRSWRVASFFWRRRQIRRECI